MAGAGIDPISARRELQRRGLWTPDDDARFNANVQASSQGSSIPSPQAVANVPGETQAGSTVGKRFVKKHLSPSAGSPNDSFFQSRAGLTRELIDQVPNLAAGLAGGVIGTGVAAATGNPAMGIAAGIATGTGVGVAAKALQTGIFEGKAPTSEQMVREAKIQAAGEVAGGAFAAAQPVARAIRRMGGVPFAEAAEVRKTIQDATADFATILTRSKRYTTQEIERQAKIGLTPAQATEGRMLDYVDNVIRGSGIFGAQHAKLQQGQEEVLTLLSHGLVEGIGPVLPADDIVGMLGKTVAKNRGEALGEFGAVHELVSRRLRTVNVPDTEMGIAGRGAKGGIINPTKSRLVVVDTGSDAGLVDLRGVRDGSLKDLREYYDTIGKNAPDPERLKSLVSAIEGLPDMASYDVVQKYRSDLGEALKLARGANVNERFTRAGGQLYGDLTQASNKALREYDRVMRPKVGKDYIGAWDMKQDADAGYKSVKRYFDKRFANDLMDFAAGNKGDPGTGRAILARFSGPGNAPKLMELKNFLGGPKAPGWRAMNRFLIDDILEKSGGQSFNASEVLEHLTSARRLGDDSARIILGSDYDRLTRTFNQLDFIQRRNRAPGTMLGQFTDAGIVFQLGGAAALGAGAGLGVGGGVGAAIGALAAPTGYLLTMAGVRHALLNPAMTDQLLTGLRPGTRTRVGMAAVTKLLGQLVEGDEYVRVAAPGDKMSPEAYGAQRAK